MGDNYLESQAKNTKKRRAKAVAAINAPKLAFRRDEVRDRFTVDCRDGLKVAINEVLRCLPSASGATVDVSRGHENIGNVAELGGGSALAAKIQYEGVGRLRVLSFDAVGFSAQVELVREDEVDGHEF